MSDLKTRDTGGREARGKKKKVVACFKERRKQIATHARNLGSYHRRGAG